MAIDRLNELPVPLKLTASVPATSEALLAIAGTDLIIIGPGIFLTSLMPLLLVEDLTLALRRIPAPMIYLDNLGRKLSLAAANMTLAQKVRMMEQSHRPGKGYRQGDCRAEDDDGQPRETRYHTAAAGGGRRT